MKHAMWACMCDPPALPPKCQDDRCTLSRLLSMCVYSHVCVCLSVCGHVCVYGGGCVCWRNVYVCVCLCMGNYSFTCTLTGDSLETSLVEKEMRLSL